MINFDLNGNLYKGAVSGYIEDKRKKDKRDRIVKGILWVVFILLTVFMLYGMGVHNTELLLNGFNI